VVLHGLGHGLALQFLGGPRRASSFVHPHCAHSCFTIRRVPTCGAPADHRQRYYPPYVDFILKTIARSASPFFFYLSLFFPSSFDLRLRRPPIARACFCRPSPVSCAFCVDRDIHRRSVSFGWCPFPIFFGDPSRPLWLLLRPRWHFLTFSSAPSPF